MNYILYENGTEINRIVASESFVAAYCEKHGYTYEEEAEEETEEEPTEEEDTAALLVDHEYRLALLELGVTEE